MDTDSEPDDVALARLPEPYSPLWFDDGNVVLQAESLRFRVYQGILRRESPVFNDVLSLPQSSSSNEETFDGFPFIRLPDAAEELKLLLSVIFDANFLDEQATIRDHVFLLSIATKYQAHRVVRRVMVILNHHYPDTLEAYDHWLNEDEDKYDCPGMPRTCSSNPTNDVLCQLLPVARRSGMHLLLPAIYVRLAREPPQDIAETREYMKLSSEDAVGILLAQRKLEQLARTIVFPALYSQERNISPY